MLLKTILMSPQTNTITQTHAYTCTKTHKPDFSEHSCGPSLTPEDALSRLAADWSPFLCQSLSLPASEPPRTQYVACILSQHATAIAKTWSWPPGAIRKIHPFILQDTHLAKQ